MRAKLRKFELKQNIFTAKVFYGQNKVADARHFLPVQTEHGDGKRQAEYVNIR